MFPTHSPPIAPIAGSLAAPLARGRVVGSGFAAMQPFTLPMPREMWIGGASRQAVASKTALVKPALSRIAQQLQAQGMALQARCHGPSGAWRVEVTVVDGLKASKVVRGPWPMGMRVDMGTPAGAAGSGVGGCGRLLARRAIQPPVAAHVDGAAPLQQSARCLVALCPARQQPCECGCPLRWVIAVQNKTGCVQKRVA